MIEFSCRINYSEFDYDVAFTGGAGITALFGPSGAGKSTTINLIAGLIRPREGRIIINDKCVFDTARGINVPSYKRRIGVTFQDALLFPHLSVGANLGFAEWFTPKPERRIARAGVVEALGIGHLLKRRPATLSGGERQRVAIARAMMTSPQLLMLDEPLAAVDEARKNEILPFIEHLRDAFDVPMIYVSHAADDVARLAAQVIHIDHGHVTSPGPGASTAQDQSVAI